MAEAIVSTVAERMVAIVEEQIRNKVNLVGGIEKKISNLSRKLKNIVCVLDDAEKRGFKEKSVKDWLKRLEDTASEMDDVLDEWNHALLKFRMKRESTNPKVRPSVLSSCLCFKKPVVHHEIANKLLNLKGQLDEILEEKDRYNFVISQPTTKAPQVKSTSFVDFAEIHGRDKERDILVSELVSSGGSQQELGVRILSILGMGGIGKTTLAQLVYNDSRVKEFFELRIWICVSDPFDLVAIAKGIIKDVEGRSPNTKNLETLFRHVIDSVSGKKFLLVLDDVWTEDYRKWKPLENSLKYGGEGSKILVTTRSEVVAKIMGTMDLGIFHLGQLSNEDCWLLMSRIALSRRSQEEFEKFQGIGKKISRKCKGLPHLAKVMGNLLSFKDSLEEWEDVLSSEIWDLDDAEVEIFPHLLLSYQDLSPAVMFCFSYCAIFPKDYVIDVERLIENWTALGYLGSNIGDAADLELKGREYFDNLAMCSLFQDFQKSDVDGQIRWCKMHDLVHDFARFMRKSDRLDAAGTKKTTCQICSPLLVATVKKYRSLPCHYDESPLNPCDCLKILRILSLRGYGLQSMPQEVGNLIHLRWLDLSEIKLSRDDTETICELYNLQFLLLERCELQEIPNKFGNLIQLCKLDLSGNDLSKGDLEILCKLYNLEFLWLSSCNLEEIPLEIGNLSRLKHLDLSFNYLIKGLPESLCRLQRLRTLNLDCCHSFSKLPQEIHKLTGLKHLHNRNTHFLYQFPQGLSQLTALCTLTKFHGGSRLNKLGLLKNLNNLSGSLELHIRLTDDMVEDAREAELRTKIHIKDLKITFFDYMAQKESSLRTEIIDALEPHPKLRYLEIRDSNSSKLPSWISPLNQVRSIMISCFNCLLSLPPLGKLPCLEELHIDQMFGLRFVRREFLGITTETVSGGVDVGPSSSTSLGSAATSTIIGFPKLKKLIFSDCPKWKEWEDITTEEEESLAVQLIPCLVELTIKSCNGLTALPHHLLRKASSLQVLNVSGSTQLQQHYKDEDGFAWKSISQNPRLLRIEF